MYILVICFFVSLLLFLTSGFKEWRLLFATSAIVMFFSIIFFIILGSTFTKQFETVQTYPLEKGSDAYYQIIDEEVLIITNKNGKSSIETLALQPIVIESSLNDEAFLLVQKRKSKNGWKLIETRYVFLLPEQSNDEK